MKKGLMFAHSYGRYHDADYAYEVVRAEYARRGIASLDKATDTVAFESLQGYDLLVLYSDLGEITGHEEGALVSWVEAGGALVALHGATASFKESAAYHALIGSAFINHPPVMLFEVRRADAEHMVTARLPESLEVEDELYLLDPRADFHTLMTARYLGKSVPITYVREQGRGRVFYCGLGHARPTLDHPRFRDIVCYGARWALGQRPRPDVRVGLVGYGPAFGMGHVHGTLASATPGMRLAAVCDLDPRQTEAAQRDFPGIRAYGHVEELAADPDVDFAVVILPHHLHAAVAGQLLDAGKHVMTEKPFVIKAADGAALIEKARAKGLTLTVFHNRRWDRDFIVLRHIVESGEIGEPYHFEAFLAGYGHPGYWWRSDTEVSGGLMYDWGAHGTDWGLNIIRDDVDYVMGWSQKRRWFDVSNDDAAKMVAHFKGGQLLDIEFGNLSAAGKPFMRVLGTKGAIEVQPRHRKLEHSLLVYREGERGLVEEVVPYGPEPGEKTEGWGSWSLVADMYRGLADHFLLGDPVPVTPESANRVIGIIEAATLSALSGRPEPPTYW